MRSSLWKRVENIGKLPAVDLVLSVVGEITPRVGWQVLLALDPLEEGLVIWPCFISSPDLVPVIGKLIYFTVEVGRAGCEGENIFERIEPLAPTAVIVSKKREYLGYILR